MKRAFVRIAIALVLICVLLIAAVWALNRRGEEPIDALTATATATATASNAAASIEQIARGAYLARAGNCMGCHTDIGGAPYAGGRGIPTPFGTIFAPNLTPDVATGIGAWSAAEFWRALHNGRARDGRLLYPAFPYPNYTRVTREDSDAIHAYLESLPAVVQTNKPHDLPFPFDQQAALAVWRALYFRAEPASQHAANDPTHDPEWNRGAYLVEGLGHCNACHASRNALGATANTLDLAGGLIPVQNWYAPSLTSSAEAGVADWDTQHIVDLLQTGVSTRGAVMGPMREVVSGSTQYLSAGDLRAMAAYLKALPQSEAPKPTLDSARRANVDSPGAKLYSQRCAACHGDDGAGVAGIYPALAGSRAVTMNTPANLVHIVLEGGFPPATKGNPRPFGMPPFATEFNDNDVAQLLTYIRGAWGNRGDSVSAVEVARYRSLR